MSILTTMATLGTGAIATGAAVLGVHATTDDPATSEPTHIACGAVWDQLSDQLQSDLGALHAMTPAERIAAAAEIRDKAVSGAYGEKAQAFAVHRQAQPAQVWNRLPAELHQDVRQLLAAAPGEREDLWADLRDAALSGEYGLRVQGAAERLQARRNACVPAGG